MLHETHMLYAHNALNSDSNQHAREFILRSQNLALVSAVANTGQRTIIYFPSLGSCLLTCVERAWMA